MLTVKETKEDARKEDVRKMSRILTIYTIRNLLEYMQKGYKIYYKKPKGKLTQIMY